MRTKEASDLMGELENFIWTLMANNKERLTTDALKLMESLEWFIEERLSDERVN